MKDLLDQYRLMARIRALEDAALALSREGFFVGSVHASNGHEAVPTGFAALLEPSDRILATYRGHGWALASGIPLQQVLGEIAQRSGGVNGGRAGSLMINSVQHGFLGENSIVGAGVPIAAGVALANKVRGTQAVAVCAFGDGAMSQGGLHEGLAFAAANHLPVVFVCENNGWAEMTPTSAVSRTEHLTDRAEGYGIPARTVDGCDVEAVMDAARWALGEARRGNGPIFIEFDVVRLKGHYNKDIEHYRSHEDIEAANSRDPLVKLRNRISEIFDGARDAEVAAIDADVAAEIERAMRAVRSMPPPSPSEALGDLYAPDSPTSWGEPTPIAGKRMPYWKAVNSALERELNERPEVLVYGEDVGKAGGIFGLTRGLQKRFGEARVFDTPIAETAILGSAVGAATQGMRPVVEIMWIDFLLVALDQLVNQAANVRYVSRGTQSAPLTVRIQQGATPGSCAQHSQSLEAFLAHVPGLRVGLPATPADAYAMTRAAIADPDPVVLIEARELYLEEGEVNLEAPVETIGGARLYGNEFDVLVVTWGAMVRRAREAAAHLADEGVRVGVLDLRWLNPLDKVGLLRAALIARGRVVIAHEANLTGGFGAEIASVLLENYEVRGALAIKRLGAADTRIPTPGALQDAVIPRADAIVGACRSLLADASITAEA